MELYVFVLALLLIRLTSFALNHAKKYPAPFMGASAICGFPKREDELMIELMNHKRSTS
jgi:hypothetical protein